MDINIKLVKMRIAFLYIVIVIAQVTIHAQHKYPNVLGTRITNFKEGDQDTIYVFPYKDTSVTVHENKNEMRRYQAGVLETRQSKLNPRLILKDGNINFISIDIRHSFYHDNTGRKIFLRTKFNYSKGIQHYIWDINGQDFMAIHGFGFRYNFRSIHDPIRASTGIRKFKLDTLYDYEAPGNQIFKMANFRSDPINNNGGITLQSFLNRYEAHEGLFPPVEPKLKGGHSLDSINKHLWVDFHFDKKGNVHGFWTYYDEFIHTKHINKKLPGSKDIGYFKEQSTTKLGPLDGPFTTVTIKGIQYLFLQDGKIFNNKSGKFEPVGKLPGDLKDTSIVWDKEADKMWYITREELDAYKAGDAKILNQLNKIQLNGKASK